MKNGWQITGVTRRSDNGFVTNIDCVYAKTNKRHIEKIRYVVTYAFDSIKEGFIPFEELTEDILLEWSFTHMGEWKEEAEKTTNKRHSDYLKRKIKLVEHINGLPF